MYQYTEQGIEVNLKEIFEIQTGLNQKYSKKVCEMKGEEYSGDWRQASEFHQVLSAADNEFYGELSDELKGHWNWFDPSKRDLVYDKNKDKVMEELADVICFLTSVCLYSGEEDKHTTPIVLIQGTQEFNWKDLHQAYGSARSGTLTDYRHFMKTAMKMLGADEVCDAYLKKVGKNVSRTQRLKEGVDVKEFEN